MTTKPLDEFRRLLRDIGSSQISSSAYDTAWVARLGEFDEELGENAVGWLHANQLPDGGWGAHWPCYYHDRFICTLAAMVTLARGNLLATEPGLRLAREALETYGRRLKADFAGETVGFEMIVPTLVGEALALGAVSRLDGDLLGRMGRARAAKLRALSGRRINRFVTPAFSSEMVGRDGLHLLDVGNLQDANGSVACSPSATAFFALYVSPRDPAALRYLHEIAANDDGGVPYVVPIDVFECAWALWNLALVGLDNLDDDMLALCQPHLDFLEANWSPQGIPSVAGLGFPDGDATSVTYKVLAQYGRSVDIGGVLSYEEEDRFRCYKLEANASTSTNIHVLSALRMAGFGKRHLAVQKVLEFLRRSRTGRLFWFDKWHASPYYSTAHAIIACAGLDDELTNDAVYWTIETQREDGSWGFYDRGTAEETAYALQALAVWQRNGGDVPADTLRRGVAWLAEHSLPPYPPLWIGKALYCPVQVVRSAILSALMLAG